MLVFSINTNHPTYSSLAQDFVTYIPELREKFPNIVSVYVLHNTGRADIVDGRSELLSGKTSIEEELHGKRFEIQPKSFFQTNSPGAERLYQEVLDLMRNKGGVLLDLYAGTGTI